jgi:hypothetical protein
MLVDWYDSIQIDNYIPDVKLSGGGMEGWELGEYKPDIMARNNARQKNELN